MYMLVVKSLRTLLKINMATKCWWNIHLMTVQMAFAFSIFPGWSSNLSHKKCTVTALRYWLICIAYFYITGLHLFWLILNNFLILPNIMGPFKWIPKLIRTENILLFIRTRHRMMSETQYPKTFITVSKGIQIFLFDGSLTSFNVLTMKYLNDFVQYVLCWSNQLPQPCPYSRPSYKPLSLIHLNTTMLRQINISLLGECLVTMTNTLYRYPPIYLEFMY